MARLVLVGLPGVGKSTVGRALAQHWDVPFCDTDDLFESSTGMTAAAYLRVEGESAFRLREEQFLSTALQGDGVVATGGGVVTWAASRDRLAAHGRIAWLALDVADILPRTETGDRPLLTDHPHEALLRIAEERAPLYSAIATWRVDASPPPAEVVEQIDRLVQG